MARTKVRRDVSPTLPTMRCRLISIQTPIPHFATQTPIPHFATLANSVITSETGEGSNQNGIEPDDDDDVVLLSAREFEEAMRRARPRTNRAGQWRRSFQNQGPVIDPQSLAPQASVSSPSSSRRLTFMCPICMDNISEEVATRCGHIFCKQCIKSAIRRQSKCPLCQNRISSRQLIRVYLPSREA